MTTVAKGKTVTSKTKTAPASTGRDPVFDELGFPKDPDNLYLQTVEVMLKAAELIGVDHGVKCILAQPQSEIMGRDVVDGEFGIGDAAIGRIYERKQGALNSWRIWAGAVSESLTRAEGLRALETTSGNTSHARKNLPHVQNAL